MNVAIIMSAGSGKRFGDGSPKQFTLLDKKPMLYYSLDVFNRNKNISGIIIVSNKANIKDAKRIGRDFSKVKTVIEGGVRRQDSVWNALCWINKNIKNCKKVFIHDAARPLITSKLVDVISAAAKIHDAVIPVVAVEDTIKKVEKDIIYTTVDRTSLVRVQTPQAFDLKKLYDSYTKFPKDTMATDDGFIMEHFGEEVTAVRGEGTNIKITYPDDTKIAEAIIGKRKMGNIIVGTGYDSHRFKKGRRFVLGGVTIPHTHGLLGHSDADALCHAIIDAVLGASGRPDIGRLFPDTDKKWKNANSAMLLKKVSEGVNVLYVDSVVITEKPKLSPYINKMRKKIASSMGIKENRVNIKSKTNEGMGVLGKGEGLIAISNVTIERNFDE
ncbi:MAG: 2-C-methyl-D-erythritol 4-phosphate cytidylyltransferase [Pseudomonadota bacterium]